MDKELEKEKEAEESGEEKEMAVEFSADEEETSGEAPKTTGRPRRGGNAGGPKGKR